MAAQSSVTEGAALFDTAFASHAQMLSSSLVLLLRRRLAYMGK